MKIEITPIDLAQALRKDEQQGDLMVMLAFLASDPAAARIIERTAERFNTSEPHRAVAPWLRQMADAIDAVEARDAALDAAGRVA